MSSRAGCGRRSRISSSRARVSSSSSPRRIERPCSNGCSSSGGAPSSAVHVYVSPSTPSVSASCEEAKPPLGSAQLAHHVVERLLRDDAVPLLAGEQPRVEVRRDEERVVVEHLLEVRHEPLRVDRVAVEAAADEVVHPAGRHPVEREPDRIERAAPQEELEHRRRRELRRVAEAAPARVELRDEPALRLGEQRLGRAARATARSRPIAAARRRAPPPARRRPPAARGTRRRPRAAPAGTRAARAAARAGSTCRRRTARRRA